MKSMNKHMGKVDFKESEEAQVDVPASQNGSSQASERVTRRDAKSGDY
jgi:hypothetical protein